MRILLLTQLFEPEPNFLKGLRFAQFLQGRGHSVQVLTGFPNYPGGRFYPGHSPRLFHRERLGGVELLRVPHYPSHDRSAVRRIASYASFATAAILLGLPRVDRPDVIHVYQGPVTLMFAAAAIARRHGAGIVLDVQDLWPESVTGSGMLGSRALLPALEAFCRWTYRRANRIVVLSEAFKERLIELGVRPDKVDVVYNWCDETAASGAGDGSEPDLQPRLPVGTLNVVYAGSLGLLQDLHAVIDAAHILAASESRIRVVFVGDGTEAGALRQYAESLGLPNVVFVPRQPPHVVARILAGADALLVHLKDHPLSRGAIPQKVQAYLAAGRPIVIGADGEAAALVERAGAGVRCRPGDPADIARAIGQLLSRPEAEREAMGRSGADYYRQHLSFARGAEKMERVFQLARPPEARQAAGTSPGPAK